MIVWYATATGRRRHLTDGIHRDGRTFCNRPAVRIISGVGSTPSLQPQLQNLPICHDCRRIAARITAAMEQPREVTA